MEHGDISTLFIFYIPMPNVSMFVVFCWSVSLTGSFVYISDTALARGGGQNDHRCLWEIRWGYGFHFMVHLRPLDTLHAISEF